MIPLIQSVVSNDLCTGCGVCIPACPYNNLQQEYSYTRGAIEPSVLDPEKCSGCDKPCDKVCPSIETRQVFETPKSHIGPAISIYTGLSSAEVDNGVSSSGGIIREILKRAIEESYCIVCLAETTDSKNTSFRAQELSTSEELSRVPGSIYHSVGFFDAVEKIRESARSVVLVALPCHLSGINNYLEKIDNDLKQKIVLKIGVICGWMFSDHSLRSFLNHAGKQPEFTRATYRGDDEVGLLKITTSNNEVITSDRRNFEETKSFINYKSSFATEANRLRCRLCMDHLNLEADLSVGDAWLEEKSGEKLSIIIARTSTGLAALEGLAARNRIILEEASTDAIYESQSKDLVEGLTAIKLRNWMWWLDDDLMRYKVCYPSIKSHASKHLAFSREMILRRVLRSGRYKTYSFLYAVTRLKRTVRHWLNAAAARRAE